MKSITLLLFLTLFSCSSDSDSNQDSDDSPYRGYYTGTYVSTSGVSVSGTMYVAIYPDSHVAGAYNFNQENKNVFGDISDNGAFTITPQGTDTGYHATFYGTVSDQSISGTWTDESRNLSGTFTAEYTYAISD